MFKFNKQKMREHMKKLEENKNKVKQSYLEKNFYSNEDDVDELLLSNIILLRRESYLKIK